MLRRIRIAVRVAGKPSGEWYVEHGHIAKQNAHKLASPMNRAADCLIEPASGSAMLRLFFDEGDDLYAQR